MNYEKLTREEIEQMATQKDVKALCELGRRYRFGVCGLEKNLTMAYRMYHKAEKMGEKDAWIALGEMYENGEYFGKNTQIAQEYYQKAGVRMSIQVNAKNISNITSKNGEEKDEYQYNQMVETKNIKSAVAVMEEIQQIIEKGEMERKQGNTLKAIDCANQALTWIDNFKRSGNAVKSNLTEMEADSYWLRAFCAFSEQDYIRFEENINKPHVLEYHPWGSYLVTVVHRLQNAEKSILNQDWEIILSTVNNPKLEETEVGDLYGMLGDLCLMGIDTSEKNMIESAYEFYKKASKLGNLYATEQLKKFQKRLFGKMQYKE